MSLVHFVAAAALTFSFATSASAQQVVSGLPRTSPPAEVSQQVGMTQVEVSYHRPSTRDRQIWGALVPYGQVWRAGANENTTIRFSHDVKIQGKELAAGTYGFHLLPQENSPWTAIFSHDARAWGSFSYDESRDALRVEVKPRETEAEEALSYRFNEFGADHATLALHWAGLAVPMKIEVDIHRQVIDDLAAQLTGLPRFSWQGWNSAAAYCVNTGQFFDECRQWSDRSLSMSRQAQNLLIHAGLLALEGKDEEIAAVEEEALGMANEQQVNAMGYQYFFQRNNPKKAVELFRRNVADYPESWNVYDSLAEGLVALGEHEEAVKHYKKALSLAPDGQKARIQGVLDGMAKDH